MYSIRRAIAEVATSQPSRKPLLLLRYSQSYSTTLNRKKSSRKSELGSTTTINSPHEGSSSSPEDANWPRPTEIPFQSTVANSVNLIGYVHMPVQSGTSANGKYWAGTVIGHDAISDSPPLRLPVMFEGNLAQSAASHIKQNDCVYVTGQLVTPLDDPLPFKPSLAQSSVQVLAHSVNFVDGSPLPKMKENSASFQQDEETLKHSVSATVNKPWDSNLDFWRDLRDNPKQWRDYRAAKHDGSVKPKHPDFKHKERGHPLWVSTAPRWILSELRELKFEQIVTSNEPNLQNCAYNSKDTKLQKCEDSWKDVLANPSKWWDNRVGKKNPKAPDFKHKDSGEALWLSSSPDWVKNELPEPKNKDTFFGRRETILS